MNVTGKSHVAKGLDIPKSTENQEKNQSNSYLFDSAIQERALCDFKDNVYIAIFDCVKAEIVIVLNRLFKSIGEICKRFSLLWLY